MGNSHEGGKKPSSKINKTQMEVACTKARIHLEMMRDRKNAEIIRGQKELVNKIQSNNRNKVEQLLIAERVTNGLKYAQGIVYLMPQTVACNQLASYAASLKSQAHYIAENVSDEAKIEPWLMHVYTLEFAAEHMGISSLNDYKAAMRSMYRPQAVEKYCNKDIIQLLSPTPSPQELNLYVVQMSQRNEIPLQQINIVGHKFTKQWQEPSLELDQNFLEMKKQLAEKMSQNFQGGNQPGNQGFPGGNGGQGGFGNQGGFPGGQGGQGGQGQYNPNFNQPPQQPPSKIDSNPYSGLSNINTGPDYYQPNEVKHNDNEKPKQFTSFEDMMKMNEQNNHKLPLYPDVDPKEYKGSQYKPVMPVHNPFTPPEQQEQHNSPSLSQIMKDFEKKE